MALDPNLYSLDLVQREEEPSVCDWVEAASRPRPKTLYTRQRALRSVDYSTILYRTLFGHSALLASVSAPTAQMKSKIVQLYDPLEKIDIKKQGMSLSTEWRFSYTAGGDKLAWRRDRAFGAGLGRTSYTCYALRSPDPNIPVAIFKPPTGQDRKEIISYDVLVGNKHHEGRGKKEGRLQFEDYNIRRLDLGDLRGLEYLLIMSLSSILDAEYDDAYKMPSENRYLSFTPAAAHRSVDKQKRSSSLVQPASLNEVAIEEWGQETDYVNHCLWLLRDDGEPDLSDEQGRNMAFIVLRAEGERHVAKAIQVAAEVKRGFYRFPRRKRGTDQEELHQYITDKNEHAQPGPVDIDAPGGRPTIRLNDPTPEMDDGWNYFSRFVRGKGKETEKGYQPPKAVSIFLSKEVMPELDPTPRPTHRLSVSIAPKTRRKSAADFKPASIAPIPAKTNLSSSHSYKMSAPVGRYPPPLDAAWTRGRVPLEHVPSGHCAPMGMTELSGHPMSGGKPPPPFPTSSTSRSPSLPPAAREHGRMSRFLARAKQVRDQPPPGSRA